MIEPGGEAAWSVEYSWARSRPARRSAETGAAEEPKAKIRLGLIGCGWYGLVVTEAAFKAGGVEVSRVCDVDSDAPRSQAAEKIRGWQGRSPRTFKDWRELLAVPGLQAVIIATPPHWHALPVHRGLPRGAWTSTARSRSPTTCARGARWWTRPKASGRVVQVGFQRRHSAAIRQAKAVRRRAATPGGS